MTIGETEEELPLLVVELLVVELLVVETLSVTVRHANSLEVGLSYLEL